MTVGYNNQHYPNMLKVIRQNAGYKQRHVAKRLEHRNTVSICDWENGKSMPGGLNLIKLCILYKKTPQELYPQYCRRLEQDYHHL